MHKRRWWILGVIVLLGGVLMIPAEARSAIGANQAFSGHANASTINVNCATGAPTGTALTSSIGVWATLGGSGNTGALGWSQQIVVTWTEGQTSVTLSDYGSGAAKTISAKASFPCPPTATADTIGTVTFQPQRLTTFSGWANTGTPTSVSITYHRVGSSS